MEYRIISDDGREYGPVQIDTLRQWAAQGRISPLTMVLRSDTGRWAHAENYAELDGLIPRAAPLPPAPDPAPSAGEAPPAISGYGAPPTTPPRPFPAAPAQPAFPLPGRGDTVLALGLVSLLSATLFSCLCLGIFIGPAAGIPAWIMGAGDLRKIDAGLMSPLERSHTKGGMICGIIGTFFGPAAGIVMTLLSILPFLSGLSSAF